MSRFEQIKDAIIDVLIEYLLKNPPAYVAEENLIPLEVFVSCCTNEKEFTRAYMQVLEIVTNKALKKLDS
jgi:hypothetical protein